MTIEAVVDPRRDPVGQHVHKVGYANRVIKKRCKRRINKRSEAKVPMALQELYVSCREVFKGPGTVPLPHDVERLCHILGTFLFAFFNDCFSLISFRNIRLACMITNLCIISVISLS